jgi:antitoxin component of MazEF toxin-antitoxin module
MLKKLVKYGNSHAIVIDRAILELLNISEGSAIKLHTDGTSLIITPQVTIPAADVVPSAQELTDRLLASIPTMTASADPMCKAGVIAMTKQIENIAQDPIQAKACEEWMPGTDNANKMQIEYAEIFKKYAHCMSFFAAPDFQKKMQELMAKYNNDLSTPEYFNEMMEMRAAYSPDIAAMDKEMMAVPKKLGAPEYKPFIDKKSDKQK